MKIRIHGVPKRLQGEWNAIQKSDETLKNGCRGTYEATKTIKDRTYSALVTFDPSRKLYIPLVVDTEGRKLN